VNVSDVVVILVAQESMAMKLQLVFDEKPRRGGGNGVSGRIAKVLYQQGIDVSSLIYDEALDFIVEGDFFSATERLRMLYTLNPTDTEALILLSKTLAARKNWQEAKHYLDIAVESGARVPKNIDDFIEQGLIRDLHNADVERKRALARDRKEIKLLKKELRKIRSTNSALNSKTSYLTEKLNNAYYMCVTIAGISLAVVFHFIIQNSGTTRNAQTQETEQTAIVEQVDPIPAKTPAEQPKEQVQNQADLQPSAEPIQEVEPEPVVAPRPVINNPQKKYPIVHIIRPGESLGKIAEKYYKNHRLWKKISTHNDIEPSKLRVGQQIEIPNPE
jgi:nucleoid-associated protein YgaU